MKIYIDDFDNKKYTIKLKITTIYIKNIILELYSKNNINYLPIKLVYLVLYLIKHNISFKIINNIIYTKILKKTYYKISKCIPNIIYTKWKNLIRTKNFHAYAARGFGKRGYFSRKINGKIVRMWDFTNEQYEALINLCIGINKILPQISLRVPYDKKNKQTPLDRISNFSTFKGILGHAHVQRGAIEGVSCKYDPGSAFNWLRLRRALAKEISTQIF